MSVTIREMTQEDWEPVAKIYRQGIQTGNATFATEVPTYDEWDISHNEDCRLVACLDEEIVGWAALSSVSSRCVYGGVAEVSVYVAEDKRGYGIGKTIFTALVEEPEKNGYWSLRSGIFPENSASIELHKKCGFRVVGHYERVGRDSSGKWRDTSILERRSKTVGID